MSIKDITKKKAYIIPVAILNILGLICLGFFAVLFFSNDQRVLAPDAMLPFRVYEIGGTGLIFGVLPLAVANLFMFFTLKRKGKFIGALAFLPALICACCASVYLYKDMNGTYADPVSADEVVLKIDLRTDDMIYGLSHSTDADDVAWCSGGATHADGSPFSKDEVVYLKFDKKTFPEEEKNEFDLKTSLYIHTGKENEDPGIKVENDVLRNAVWGQAYDYVITGNSKDGYILH